MSRDEGRRSFPAISFVQVVIGRKGDTSKWIEQLTPQLLRIRLFCAIELSKKSWLLSWRCSLCRNTKKLAAALHARSKTDTVLA
jgi:hypothetical protein